MDKYVRQVVCLEMFSRAIVSNILQSDKFLTNYARITLHAKTKIFAYSARIFVIFSEIKIGSKYSPIRFHANILGVPDLW